MQAALKPLRLVKTGPAGELETLVQTHHARVFRTARRITGSTADAEDVLPKRFFAAGKRPETYDLSKIRKRTCGGLWRFTPIQSRSKRFWGNTNLGSG